MKKTFLILICIITAVFTYAEGSRVIRLKKTIVFKNASIMVPYEWSVEENEESLGAYSNEEDSKAELHLNIEPMSFEITVNDYLEMTKTMLEGSDTFMVVETGDNFIIYKTKFDDGLMGIYYFFVENKTMYILTFMSEIIEFECYYDDFKIIADNFKIIKEEDDLFKDFSFLYEKDLWNERTKVSREFERLYNNYHDNEDFEDKLFSFLGEDEDRYYWIGIFLFEEYYTDVFDYELARKVLSTGMNYCEEYKKASFLFEIGMSYWKQDLKEEAAGYFIKAFDLAEKYPGSIPAISEEEWNAIDEFMEKYKK